MMSTKDENHAIKATLLFQIAHYGLRPWIWIVVALAAITLYDFDTALNKSPYREAVAQWVQKTAIKSQDFAKDSVHFAAAITKKSQAQQQQLWSLYQDIHGSENTEVKKALQYKQNPRFGYVFAMRDFLPTGLKGLLLVAFFAAYMSTVSTQLNWGSSYIINDFYQRFVRPKASSKHLVLASRMAVLLLMLISLFVTSQIDSLTQAFEFLIECSVGLGAVLILRWYWWRINAWSEIVATLAPILGYVVAKQFLHLDFPYSLFFTLSVSSVAWIAATFLTPPTDAQTLEHFYLKIKPEGAWQPVRKALNLPKQTSKMPLLLGNWLLGIVLGYAFLFGLGYALFAEWQAALWCLLAIVIAVVWLSFNQKKAS
ncbi:MAG: hypothetical protein JJT94_07700 [Bernardetiaceae bacterium]|nr:hypothetical protein [Bernardetiaceae bacterium]